VVNKLWDFWEDFPVYAQPKELCGAVHMNLEIMFLWYFTCGNITTSPSQIDTPEIYLLWPLQDKHRDVYSTQKKRNSKFQWHKAIIHFRFLLKLPQL